MKILTKEWYDLMQKTDLHLLLKANKKAEVFSEEFYRNLYAKKEAEQLRIDKEFSAARFEDIFDEFDFFSKEEYERAREEFVPKPFDAEETVRRFREAHEQNIEWLKSTLPKDILNKVADIRVLALDCCTNEVRKLIASFCKKNERQMMRAFKEVDKAERNAFGDTPPNFLTETSLHDCEITALEKSGSDVVLRLDSSGGFTTCTGVVFKNAEIVEQEGDIVGAFWLYDEVYKTDDGRLEIHALLSGKNENLYFTVRCKATEFIKGEA